jgi:hypothetical protein
VVVGVVLYFMLKKKPRYDLSVSVGTGVTGNPSSGTTTHTKGETVSYNYSLQPGYSDMNVTLDGNQVPANGAITMNQNHTLNATSSANEPGFVTNVDDVTVPEEGTADFKVKLSQQPAANVNVTVNRHSGDSDISVQSGSLITFTTSNWDTYQTVTLTATDDKDTLNGEAVIRIIAEGIAEKDITAVEQDNDDEEELTFITDTERVIVPEGGTADFKVKLSEQPAANVNVMVNRHSGDSDISVQSGSSLTFTPSNWYTYQTVTLTATDDEDTLNGEAVIRIRGGDLPDKEITAIEEDNTPSTTSITVTSPNGGESWKIASTQKITWEAPGVPSAHKLLISLYKFIDGEFEYYGKIVGSRDPEMGYYDWYVGKLFDGTIVPPSNKYLIKISSVDGSDMSDGYFEIIY